MSPRLFHLKEVLSCSQPCSQPLSRHQAHALPARYEDEPPSEPTTSTRGIHRQRDVSIALSRVIARNRPKDSPPTSHTTNQTSNGLQEEARKWRPSPPRSRASDAQAKARSQDHGILLSPNFRPRPTSSPSSSPPSPIHQVPGSASNSIVIVEGWTDANAVQSALDLDVYVCNGDEVRSGQSKSDLSSLQSSGRGLIILTDPDREGRDLRCYLDTLLCSPSTIVRHAFVPASSATSSEADSRHEAGNRGIEHAGPASISLAISEAAPSFEPSRAVFSAEFLRDLGLMNSFDAKTSDGAKMRRDRLCDELGLGVSTGGALVKMLNRFFTMEKVMEIHQRLNSIDNPLKKDH